MSGLPESFENWLLHGDPLVPTWLVVVATLAGGLIASLVLRALTVSLSRRLGVDRLAERWHVGKTLTHLGVRSAPSRWLGQLVLLAGLLVSALVALELAGLEGLAAMLGSLVSGLPGLVAGGLLLVLGLTVAHAGRGAVRRFAKSRPDLESPELVGRITYWAVLTFAIMLALQQVGLETTLLNRLVLVAAGATVLSAGLALALAGRRPLEGHLVSRQYAEVLRPGDRVTLEAGGGGIVLRHSPVGVVLGEDGNETVVAYATLASAPFSIDPLRLAPVPLESDGALEQPLAG